VASEDPWYRGETVEDGDVADEFDRRDALRRGDFSRWRAGGGTYAFTEPWTGMPERYFLLQLEGTWYAGCKTLSDYVVEEGGSGLLCSRVHWSHLAGTLTGTRSSDTDVRIGFSPLAEEERRRVFDAIGPSTEILHPFPLHEAPGREPCGPAEGWFLTEERADLLAMGERHLRAYTRELLGPRFGPGCGGVTAYDPACSTGRFLADFAAVNPAEIRTVGQDLSAQMTGYAAAHLDEVHHGDAVRPCLGEGEADVVFSRFLNSEVVTTAQARAILPALVRTVRKGGLMVLFGHTPLLVDAHDLTAQGLRVLRTTGRREGWVFQYYVCQKPD
jgi:isonocardicin synthase